MKPSILLGISLISLTGLFFLFQGSSSMNAGTSQGMTSQQASAKENFQKFCAGCHGNKMERFAGNTWEAYKAGNDLTPVIKNGLPTVGMPSFAKAFTDAEMKEISNYILTELKDKKEAPARTKFTGTIHSKRQSFKVDTVASGLDVPWGMAFLPNNELLVSERSGQLFLFQGGMLKSIINGVPDVMAQGQGGLMDIVLHPDYKNNGWIYFSYSKKAPDGKGGNTAIFRAKLKGDELVEKQELFKAMPNTNSGVHFGCRMVFDDKGYLYFSVGERGEKTNAQTLKNHCGKIHRIFDDGRIPAENPIVHTPGGMPTIY